MSDSRGSGGGSLWMRARQLLASYRGDRALTAEEWLELAHEAHAYALSTFPEERRERALRGFVEKHCEGQAPRTIAVFALALRMFGELREREGFGQFGSCLEAAAVACGTTIEELPPPRDPESAPAAPTAGSPQRQAPQQEGLLTRKQTGALGVEYWN